MKNIDQLNDLFNTDPIPPAQDPQPEQLPVVLPQSKPGLSHDQQEDFDLARETLRSLIYKGQNTLDDLVELAKNSEHPRNYEVAGQIMKTLSDTAKDLLELQKKAQGLKQPDDVAPPNSIGTQNNNIVFTGSTSDLMKMLRNEKDI